MDLTSTRTAASTITPEAQKPKTYGDTLHDFFIENRSTFEPDGITPEGLAGPVKTTFPLVDGKLQFSEHLFDDDALVIEGNQAKGVDLADKNGESYLRVKFDAPLFGIWSPAKIQAPFVCIEPWYGRCDAQEFNGSVEDREWGNHLEPDEVFEAGYEVILL